MKYKEAMEALNRGKKVRLKTWNSSFPQTGYYYKPYGAIRWYEADGKSSPADLLCIGAQDNDWEVVEEEPSFLGCSPSNIMGLIMEYGSERGISFVEAVAEILVSCPLTSFDLRDIGQALIKRSEKRG